MSAPDPTGPAIRVYNRSDRVWLFGLVWLLPFLLLAGMVAVPWLLTTVPRVLLMVPPFIILGIQYVLVWRPSLAPVKYLRLTEQIEIVRVAGRTRSYSADRVEWLELAAIEGADYDDRERGRQFSQVTVRFYRTGPARLVVSLDGLRWLTDWARRHDRPVHEAKAPGDASGHESG